MLKVSDEKLETFFSATVLAIYSISVKRFHKIVFILWSKKKGQKCANFSKCPQRKEGEHRQRVFNKSGQVSMEAVVAQKLLGRFVSW